MLLYEWSLVGFGTIFLQLRLVWNLSDRGRRSSRCCSSSYMKPSVLAVSIQLKAHENDLNFRGQRV